MALLIRLQALRRFQARSFSSSISSVQTGDFLHVSAYKFAKILETDLPDMKDTLQSAATNLEVNSTFLIGTEGVNLQMSGRQPGVDRLKDVVRNVNPGFQDIEFKDSFSDSCSLRRVVVKIRDEIIPMRQEGADPSISPSPAKHLPAKEFHEWLENDKPMILLDTRNEYEVRVGTFLSQGKPARTLGIQRFVSFPAALRELQLTEEEKQLPVVTFCTGGIRCEKTAFAVQAVMEEGDEGVGGAVGGSCSIPPAAARSGEEGEGEETGAGVLGGGGVYQLSGGIIKYFEEVGGAAASKHFNGECYVFDDRIAVTPALTQGKTVKCGRCGSPVTEGEQTSPLYIAPPPASGHNGPGGEGGTGGPNAGRRERARTSQCPSCANGAETWKPVDKWTEGEIRDSYSLAQFKGDRHADTMVQQQREKEERRRRRAAASAEYISSSP